MFKIFSSQKHSLNINTSPTFKYYLCSMQYVTCQYFRKSVILEEFQGFHCFMSSILKNLCHILSPFFQKTLLFGSGWHNLINQRSHCQVAWYTLSLRKKAATTAFPLSAKPRSEKLRLGIKKDFPHRSSNQKKKKKTVKYS